MAEQTWWRVHKWYIRAALTVKGNGGPLIEPVTVVKVTPKTLTLKGQTRAVFIHTNDTEYHADYALARRQCIELAERSAEAKREKAAVAERIEAEMRALPEVPGGDA